ncbi:hypothetical protein M8J77_020059 [Diaphorina citri]|nr:hypothetical protein M8J77_020059 [Diaphorina citri]
MCLNTLNSSNNLTLKLLKKGNCKIVKCSFLNAKRSQFTHSCQITPSPKLPIDFRNVFRLVTATLCNAAQNKVGIIVPPKNASNAGIAALFDPSHKPSAPSHLPSGVTVPSQPVYGPGKVVTSTKPAGNGTVTIHSASSTSSFPRPRPQTSHLNVAHLLSQLFGTTTNPLRPLGTSTNPLRPSTNLGPFGLDLSSLPSNADVNIQVIQPFYASRPGYFGARPVVIRPFVTGMRPYTFPAVYGSYPRQGLEENGSGTQMRPQDFAEHFLQSFFNPGNSFAPGTNPYGGYGGGFQFSWN